MYLRRADVKSFFFIYSMDEMDESLKEIPALLEQLHDVSKLNIKHSQLATARENMKHIFMVPETVRQAEQLIQASH